jgi:hypothetical protein
MKTLLGRLSRSPFKRLLFEMRMATTLPGKFGIPKAQ